VIDLHCHTTASDGSSTPERLMQEAASAGVRVIAVTDHDTTAGLTASAAAASARGLEFVPGIEITAVFEGRDVHVLGYFIDAACADLQAFLLAQRSDRRRRAIDIAERLSAIGAPIDIETVLSAADRQTGKSVGRPAVAAALVRAGHAASVPDAFDRYIGEGRPGFVERRGPSPADVVRQILAAGGLASLAHPGKLGRDEIIEPLVRAGMAAIEVFHPDHDEAAATRYAAIAQQLDLLVSGGSDYHGPDTARAGGLGRIGVDQPAFQALVARAGAEGRP
jgi:hypothetical protein